MIKNKKIRFIGRAAAALIALLLPALAQAATLQVEVTGLRSDEGQVYVAVCNTQACFERESDFLAEANDAPRSGRATFAFELPLGEYTIMTYHDENDSGNFDKSFLGLPKEGFGFSNDAEPILGKPSYERVKFVLAPPRTEITIRMQYIKND